MMLLNRSTRWSRLFTVVFAIFAASLHAQAPAGQKLTEAKIIELLDKKMPEQDIVKLIESQYVDFELTPKITAELARKGASDKLLTAVERGKAPDDELVISSPIKNEEVSQSYQVEGRSRDFSSQGKTLWVFAHRADLVNQWWPQNTRVEVNETGDWKRGVTFGGDQDGGFDFEIVAEWVDAKSDQKLQNYISSSVKSGHYLPMPLPKGSPTVKVIVKRGQ